jgi:hypothetical protein
MAYKRAGVEAARRPDRALHVAALFGALLLYASAALCQESPSSSPSPVGDLRADVDLNDVSAESALRFLAEIYDVSLTTGELPDTRVTLRLRGLNAAEAFEVVALTAGLEVERHGSVLFVSSRAHDGAARRIVFGPFPWTSATSHEWLAATGVESTPVGDDAVLLEGAEASIAAVVEAIEAARPGLVVEQVFPLGAAPGEETLQAVSTLLDPELESASYDPTGHLLTVSALPATLDHVEPLLDRLTQSPEQYEIEVKVVEVSTNALRRIGAQGFFSLQANLGNYPTTFPMENLDDSFTYFPSPNELAELSNTASRLGSQAVPILPGSLQESGFRFGSVDARGVGLLIEFLEQSGDARVMATPKVTSLDNRQALISMVTTLRIPTYTQNVAFATTAVSGIEKIDVGTTLEVRPRRTEGGILLDVTPEVSELVPTVAAFNPKGLNQDFPTVMRRRTQTEVILDEGETLVIGGLVIERERETVGETPGLSKIPWLGRAFQRKATESHNSELLVFVTPHVLPPPEERQARVRVDNSWLPTELAWQIQAARGLLTSPTPDARVAGTRMLDQIDDELLEADLDVGQEVVRLGADSAPEVRAAAALFLLHRRPETAIGEILRFSDGRSVAVTAVSSEIAPHQRAALAEILSRSPGGVDLLVERLEQSAEARDPTATGNLLEALGVAAPESAARLAVDLAARTPGLLAQRQLIDALSGAPGDHSELAALAQTGKSVETRAYAEAGLVRSIGTPGASANAELGARIQRFHLGVAQQPPTEAGLGWNGKPAEIAISGDPLGVDLTRVALDLLAARAPDLRQLVGFALARIDVGTAETSVDPQDRSARLKTAGVTPEHLALRMVRLASIVFDSRVLGFPAYGERALAHAVRQEIRALERLTGASCSADCADGTVLEVLAGDAAREAGDV